MEVPIYNQRGTPTKETIRFDPSWIINDEGLKPNAVDFADAFGKHLIDPYWNEKANAIKPGKRALSTTQLRNFFGEIRRIQLKGYSKNTPEFIMLKPKLAYAKARVLKDGKGNKIEDFELLLSSLISNVSKEQHFLNFVNFVEAIVAYHKAYGGN